MSRRLSYRAVFQILCAAVAAGAIVLYNSASKPVRSALQRRGSGHSTLHLEASLVPSTTKQRHALQRNETSNLQPDAPLAVVFTTFSDSPLKLQLFSNTVKNWAQFSPQIQPLLFTTNETSPLNTLALKHGWLAVRCPRVNEYGTPFLKDMYFSAHQLARVPFYGFINGDILFDQSLVRTLRRLVADVDNHNSTSTLVTGRRWDYYVRNETTFAAWKPQDVIRLVKNSTLSRTDTEDYFLVSGDFPWAEIKDVVIGRPGYDNYLVARSIQLNVTTIDATKTVTALHQMGTYVDRNTKKDGGYDKKLIGKFNYYAGLTSKTRLMTAYDDKGEVSVRKRNR